MCAGLESNPRPTGQLTLSFSVPKTSAFKDAMLGQFLNERLSRNAVHFLEVRTSGRQGVK